MPDSKKKYKWYLLYFISAMIFVFLYDLKIIDAEDFTGRNSIDAVSSFTAAKPFQFRLFVPFLFLLINFIDQQLLFFVYSVIVVFFIQFFYIEFLKEHFKENSFIYIASLLILYPMYWNYIILNDTFQYYDLTSILFFIIGIYLISVNKPGIFYLVYVIALINKESAVYLIFVYMLFNYKNIFKKQILLNSALMMVLFLGVKLGLSAIFRNNTGDNIEITLPGNIEIIQNILSNRIYAKNILFSFGGLYFIVILFLFSGLIRQRTGYERKRRIYMNLAFVPYFLLGIFIVYFTEVRVYAEVIPLFTTLSLYYISSIKNSPLHLKTFDR